MQRAVRDRLLLASSAVSKNVGANGGVRHKVMARRSNLLGKADPAAVVSCTRMLGPSRRDVTSTLRVAFICGNGFSMLCFMRLALNDLGIPSTTPIPQAARHAGVVVHAPAAPVADDAAALCAVRDRLLLALS